MNKTLEAAFVFAGTIIGAGVLALPSLIAKTGFIYGTMLIFMVGLAVLTVALMLGEVVLRTNEPHQLPGLAQKYAGKKTGTLAVIFSMLAIYGALVAYIHGCGLVLSELLGISINLAKILFFAPVTLIVYFGIKGVEESETLLTGIMVACLIAISAAALFFFEPSNIIARDFSEILLPIGVLVFALEGLPAIPQMKEILWEEKKNLMKSIIIGFSIPVVLYTFFCFASIGALGTEISEVATMSLSEFGDFFIIFGSIFALLAMSTGFISLSNALSETYSEDLKFGKISSWVLACFVPLIALTAANIFLPSLNFAQIVAYTGILFTGPYYIITIYTFHKARKSGEREPEYTLKIPDYVTRMMLLLFIAFSAWAIYTTFSPMILS